MAAPRRVYGLCSVDDPTIVYVGSTTVTLKKRRVAHLKASYKTDTPVARWIGGVGSRSVRIVLLHEDGSIALERAEIARRIAAGEPLLNVHDGGICPPSQRFIKTRVDAEGHRHAEATAPSPVIQSATLADDALPHRYDGQPWWKLVNEANRPIVPREPLHPYNRTPSQVAALAASRAARAAHREAA